MSAARDYEAEFEAAGRAMEAKASAVQLNVVGGRHSQPVKGDIRQDAAGDWQMFYDGRWRGLDDDTADGWAAEDDQLDTPLNAWVRPFVWRDPSTLPRREWLYGRHYIRKFVSATFSPGGVGKSSLVLTEALAMASRKPLLGVHPESRLRVAYWNGEDPMEETERRAFAAAIHHGLDGSSLNDWLFLGSGRDVPLVLAEQSSIGTTILAPNVELVVDTVRELELDAIIIDPFVSSHRVTENDNNAIDMVVKEWARIADRANISVELVRHTRKANGAETTVEDGRGASALLYAARSARALNVMTKEEADRAGVERHRSYFRVDNGKANLAPPPEGSDWFQMIGVDLENGDAFNESDQVGVVTRWQWPDPFEGVQAADLLAVQRKVDGGLWRENSQAKEWVGIAIADVLGLDLDDKAAKQKVKGLLARWLKEGLLVKVMASDEKSRERPVVEVGKWVVL